MLDIFQLRINNFTILLKRRIDRENKVCKVPLHSFQSLFFYFIRARNSNYNAGWQWKKVLFWTLNSLQLSSWIRICSSHYLTFTFVLIFNCLSSCLSLTSLLLCPKKQNEIKLCTSLQIKVCCKNYNKVSTNNKQTI